MNFIFVSLCKNICPFMYLLLAVLGLHCCVRVFSSCDQWGLLLQFTRASHCGGFPCGGAWALSEGSAVVLTGLVAPQHVESSWSRDWARVPCIGKSTLHQSTTREVLQVWKGKGRRGGSHWVIEAGSWVLHPSPSCDWLLQVLSCLHGPLGRLLGGAVGE